MRGWNGLFLVFVGFLMACSHETKEDIKAGMPNEFINYWFNGTAEITSYKLEQARYGELRKGSAVAIFVTEDFSKRKQVKLDNPSEISEDVVPILKFNLTKSFTTGIYPYSMMLSVFKPIDFQKIVHPLKITSTSQEWCGQTYWQLNSNKDGYEGKLFSYFEKEGDQVITLPRVWLEDEIWSQIRMNPKLLPIGEFPIISGGIQQRLLHHKIIVYNANGVKITSPDSISETGRKLCVYKLVIREIKKELIIYYEEDFPHVINGWCEKYEDGVNKKILTTTAVKSKTIKIDYWNHNKVQDSTFRKTLNLN